MSIRRTGALLSSVARGGPSRLSHLPGSTFRSKAYSTASTSSSSKRRRVSPLLPMAILSGLATAYLLSPSVSAAGNDNDEITALTTTTTTTTSPSSRLNSLTSAPTSHILRSYLVYSACSIPPLIDNAPGLLHFFTHSPIPGLKGLTEAIVRRTFFAQFVPGENVGECTPKMEELRERNIGAVLNYSAEAECETKEDARRLQEARLKEVYRALEGAGEFEDRVAEKGGLRGSTAFALKVTGLIDPDILARASTTILRLRPLTHSNAPSSPFSAPLPPVPYPGTPSDVDSRVVAHPKGDDGRVLLALKGTVEGMGLLEGDEGLREGDMEELRRLWGDLRDLGSFAKRKGVKLMIDAEHTWYQPALDAYTLLLSQEFNRPPRKPLGGVSSEWNGPLIFGTYQSYLTRQPQHLLAAIRHAESDGYALGVKLVRGAYFVQERKRWKDDGRPGPDPIWPDKPSTDRCYDTAVTTLITTMASQLASSKPHMALSVIFGTHNPESCSLIAESLEKQGLASEVEGKKGLLRLRDDVRGKVFVAQLYGMKDDLTDRMASTFEANGMPVALKYIAYGSLSEVMPFLGRRAIENKSVMSGEGGAAAERQRLASELWRRWFGRA